MVGATFRFERCQLLTWPDPMSLVVEALSRRRLPRQVCRLVIAGRIVEPLDRRRLVLAEPLIVNLLVSAVFAQCQERFIHPLAQRTIGWEDDAVVFLVDYTADDLRQSLAVMRCVIDDRRCVKHDGGA